MVDSERRRYWEAQLTSWQASGVSGQAFCKAQGLVYHRFTYWRRKLLASPSGSGVEGAAGFARVSLSPTASTSGELTVQLPGGLSITGLHAGNVNLLGDILRQL